MSGPTRPATGLSDDWVTIWQSELAALAADRETAEHARVMLDAWFAATAALRRHDGAAPGPAPQPPWSNAPQRTAPAAAASDAGDAIARLERRLAELERRLDAGVAE